jgi:hypothetical protein
MPDILQFTITLKNSKPLIWRSILVKKETTFFELHHIIQISMGWKNYHLFEFNLDGYKVGMIEGNDYGFGNSYVLDATRVALSDVLSLENDRFDYDYDFGDRWQHEIVLQQAIEKDDKTVYPTCVGGKLNCPPEDCGGIRGFYDLLNIIQDNSHPEHQYMRNWVGEKYNPESFDLNRASKRLRKLQKYITRWNSPD